MLSFQLLNLDLAFFGAPPKNSCLNDRTARDGLFKHDENYVYRADLIKSIMGDITTRTAPIGHVYHNTLRNIQEYRCSNIQYVKTMFENMDRMKARNGELRGLYFWPSFNSALYFQITLMRNSLFVKMDERRNIQWMDKLRLIDGFSIMSRVRRDRLPDGMFFDDLKPQDAPCGMVHIVEQIGSDNVSIPHQDIEFWLDSDWRSGTNIPFHDLSGIAEEGRADVFIHPIPTDFIA